MPSFRRRRRSAGTPAPVADDPPLVERAEIFDALSKAVECRELVIAALGDSEDVREGALALQELLGISEQAAMEVLDLQLRRLVRSQRRRIDQRRDELREAQRD